MRGTESEQHKLQSLTQFCSRQQAGFLKGPGARGAGPPPPTLQTCCTAWLTDHATTNRSCDEELSITPCLTEP